MSIEIWQFPTSATRRQLTEHLGTLRFTPGDNPFSPGPPGTLSFFWSESVDYKSTSGVDASVFPLDDRGKSTWKTTTDWGLRTRTSAWASSFDKEHQNRTVRSVRKRFGGSFYNDHEGRNRYIRVVRTESTPASRGLYAVLSRLEGELDRLEEALPDEKITSLGTPTGVVTDDNDDTGVLRFTKRFDPSRVVYNALVPFLLAALEHLFRETFEVLLQYDGKAQAVLDQQNRKVSFPDARAIKLGERSVESIASSWFSFQNVDSIQKAFKEVHGIDVQKALRRRKKVRDRLPILMNAFQTLIGARHDVVHHFSLDRSLDRTAFLDLLHLVRAIIDVMADTVEAKLKVRISPG